MRARRNYTIVRSPDVATVPFLGRVEFVSYRSGAYPSDGAIAKASDGFDEHGSRQSCRGHGPGKFEPPVDEVREGQIGGGYAGLDKPLRVLNAVGSEGIQSRSDNESGRRIDGICGKKRRETGVRFGTPTIGIPEIGDITCVEAEAVQSCIERSFWGAQTWIYQKLGVDRRSETCKFGSYCRRQVPSRAIAPDAYPCRGLNEFR